MIRRTFSFIALLVFCLGCTSKDSSSNEVRIGAIVSLVGAAGEQGTNWLRGAELATEEAQARGIPVKLVIEDDRTEPAKVISAFTKLAEVDKVRGIVGGTWDYLGEAAYPLAKRYKIPFITPTNPVEVLSADAKANPYVFSNSMTLAAMRNAARSFFEKMDAKTIGLIYPNLPFGQSQADVITEIAKEKGLEIVYRYEFPVAATMSDNVRLAALKLNEIRPDATFAVLDYNGLDLITQEFSKLKYFPAILTTQHLDQAFVFSKDPGRYRKMYAVYPKVSSKEFAERFKARFSEAPRVYAAHGYDAVEFLIQALQAGVQFGTASGTVRYDGITGTHIFPAPSRGLVVNEAVIMTTKNGVFEELS